MIVRVREESGRVTAITSPVGVPVPGPTGPSDHGALTGLVDDDHPHYAIRAATRTIHEPIAGPSRGTNSPGQGPTPTISGALLALAFTPNDAADRLFRIFKIPTNYVADAAFHVHWTKSTNADENTKAVRWRISYVVFDGLTQNAAGAPSTLELEDTYDASDTTARVVHRTANASAAGFVAGYYVAAYIEAISPVGTPLAFDPALVSLDLTYTATINLGT